jgi:photosystem II stability/assembly factor-like uncharacterized protein
MLSALVAGFASATSHAADSAEQVDLRKAPAWRSATPQATPLLAATRAGKRLVAVGTRGMVLLSDDEGNTWRQAAVVPVRSALTSVDFIDERNGWAVGHDGVIVHTSDGGDHWVLQRFDALVDQPLFSVKFTSASHGVAVGLWSLVLVTDDAGSSWKTIKLDAPPGGGKADRNLLSVFSDGHETLYAAAEKGTVLTSKDGGMTWAYHDTGYKGSFWCGVALPEGVVLVAGLRGNIYRSQDAGQTWQHVDSQTQSSLTGISAQGSEVVAVGLDGTKTVSTDGGSTFHATQRDDRVALTAVVRTASGAWRLFSDLGVVTR